MFILSTYSWIPKCYCWLVVTWFSYTYWHTYQSYYLAYLLQHFPLARCNCFLADITNAELNQAAGMEAGTHSMCELSWHQWFLYLHELNIPSHDPFFTDFFEHHRIIFLCAFIQYVKDGNCSRGGDSVRAATSRKVVDYVAPRTSGWIGNLILG